MTPSNRSIIHRANQLGYFPLVKHCELIKIHMAKWGHVYDMPNRRDRKVAAMRREANADIQNSEDAAIREVMEGEAGRKRAG